MHMIQKLDTEMDQWLKKTVVDGKVAKLDWMLRARAANDPEYAKKIREDAGEEYEQDMYRAETEMPGMKVIVPPAAD